MIRDDILLWLHFIFIFRNSFCLFEYGSVLPSSMGHDNTHGQVSRPIGHEIRQIYLSFPSCFRSTRWWMDVYTHTQQDRRSNQKHKNSWWIGCDTNGSTVNMTRSTWTGIDKKQNASNRLRRYPDTMRYVKPIPIHECMYINTKW